jgi:hypothetical protein
MSNQVYRVVDKELRTNVIQDLLKDKCTRVINNSPDYYVLEEDYGGGSVAVHYYKSAFVAWMAYHNKEMRMYIRSIEAAVDSMVSIRKCFDINLSQVEGNDE